MGEKSVMFDVDGEVSQEAILDWYYYGGSGRVKKSSRKLTFDAKRYLSNKGWVFWYAPKNGKQELRYQSPKGKVYYSLKTACKSVIDEGLGDERNGNLEPKQPKKRKSSCLETPPLSESLRSESLKRRKKSKKQENRRQQPVGAREHQPLMEGQINVKITTPSRSIVESTKTVKANSVQHEKDTVRDSITAQSRSNVESPKTVKINYVQHEKDAVFYSATTPRSSNVLSPKTLKDNSFQPENNEVCSACSSGGELICCEYCPAAFHMKCLGLKKVPNGDWFCPSCCCGICGIGYLKDRRYLTCLQCELKFHIDCFSMKKSSEMIKSDINRVFCSDSCQKIFDGLHKLTGKPILVGNNLTWTLLKSDPAHGMKLSAKDHSKLSASLKVMHECFTPSIDVLTGRDLVEDVIFSRISKLKRLDFRGFYTVILEKNDDIVSVATLRVYDNKVAEMPLAATRFKHRRRGMCRVLMDEVEKYLVKLGVEKLILPSMVSTLDTWTNKFGFSRMKDEDRAKLLQYSLLNFQGTIFCQKHLG